MLTHSMLASLIKKSGEASNERERIFIKFLNDGAKTVSIQNKGAVPEEIQDRFFDKYTISGKRAWLDWVPVRPD